MIYNRLHLCQIYNADSIEFILFSTGVVSDSTKTLNLNDLRQKIKNALETQPQF